MPDKSKNIADDRLIVWFINNHGSFGFISSGLYGNKAPAFQLKVGAQDIEILEKIKDYLELKNRIYKYHYSGKEKAKRKPQVFLIIRDFKQLKNAIIPFFYKNLVADKKTKFIEWLDKIGKDPTISERFRSLYRLYKSGVYNR